MLDLDNDETTRSAQKKFVSSCLFLALEILSFVLANFLIQAWAAKSRCHQAFIVSMPDANLYEFMDNMLKTLLFRLSFWAFPESWSLYSVESHGFVVRWPALTGASSQGRFARRAFKAGVWSALRHLVESWCQIHTVLGSKSRKHNQKGD